MRFIVPLETGKEALPQKSGEWSFVVDEGGGKLGGKKGADASVFSTNGVARKFLAEEVVDGQKGLLRRGRKHGE